ncbi:hypothetical protein [Massilia rhizosphaerae]|uniref:hypothetical protein n=1 Tax=Massilia rhizosphaerae TaxID=2784389 RepID=UPI0018DC0CC6|nr:hypothetical protein [Massilia rhizosphaerae]
MSLAFEKFIKQYNATGSEKADGYSPDVFVGLDEVEKEKVFDLLVTELPWGIEWLFFLDSQKALEIAKERESKLRGNPYAGAYVFQQQIVKYSGDLLYQRHMIDDYPGYPENIRPLVVDAMHRTPDNENTIAFYKNVILAEANSSAVARASRHLLDALKVPRATDAEKEIYRGLVAELRKDDAQAKLRAFARLEKYMRNLTTHG